MKQLLKLKILLSREGHNKGIVTWTLTNIIVLWVSMPVFKLLLFLWQFGYFVCRLLTDTQINTRISKIWCLWPLAWFTHDKYYHHYYRHDHYHCQYIVTIHSPGVL